MPNLVDYHIITPQAGVPPFEAYLYDYLFASNGVFIRSRRPGLEVTLPVALREIRGLAPVTPFVRFTLPPVPAHLVDQMLWCAQGALGEGFQPVESLFHLEHAGEWQLTIPPQERTSVAVRPLEDGVDSSYASALIEVHSHHAMRAFFSSADTQDEQGFRIYAVLGNIFERPEIRVRVGCEGVHWDIPATTAFELPAGLIDASLHQEADREDRQEHLEAEEESGQ